MSTLPSKTGDSTEEYYAEMEAARNTSLDAYFIARPQLLRTHADESIFRAGFERAFSMLWNKAHGNETDPVATDPCRVALAIGLLESFRDGRINALKSTHESLLGGRAQLENDRDVFGYAIDALRTLNRSYGPPSQKASERCRSGRSYQGNLLTQCVLTEGHDGAHQWEHELNGPEQL